MTKVTKFKAGYGLPENEAGYSSDGVEAPHLYDTFEEAIAWLLTSAGEFSDRDAENGKWDPLFALLTYPGPGPRFMATFEDLEWWVEPFEVMASVAEWLPKPRAADAEPDPF